MGNERVTSHPVAIAAAGVELCGEVTLPRAARGLVVFVHGSGSSRKSPRNRRVAAALVEAGLATLLFDLLAEEERGEARLRFDIERLAARLLAVIDWAHAQPATRHLPIGLFGASTGAAAALEAAASRPGVVRCVVSRGGRPDLAPAALAVVGAPTLLVVGGADPEVLALNQEAAGRLPHATIAVVPGASHLFEEEGALEEVARLASAWFIRHLGTASTASAALPRVALPFTDRRAAGALLARGLGHYAGLDGLVVLGLPRGGVPVADEVARALRAPLDVVVVRKLGAPFQRELAMGAIAPDVCVLNREVAAYFDPREIEQALARETLELQRREQLFRAGRPALDVRGRTVLLVDDGLATGATMRAAVAWARRQQAGRVVVAVPVASSAGLELLAAEADEVVCLATPDEFVAVGLHYRDFDPVSEADVARILESSPPRASAHG
jgi:predicted phosphoribosyltransferase/dienelactone hydrolase